MGSQMRTEMLAMHQKKSETSKRCTNILELPWWSSHGNL